MRPLPTPLDSIRRVPRPVLARRAFTIVEMMVALSVVMIVAVVFSNGLNQLRRGERILGHRRAAMRLAEDVLTRMQTGLPIDPEPARGSFTIRWLDDPGPAEGWRWVEVNASVEQRVERLIGPAPLAYMPGENGEDER